MSVHNFQEGSMPDHEIKLKYDDNKIGNERNDSNQEIEMTCHEHILKNDFNDDPSKDTLPRSNEQHIDSNHEKTNQELCNQNRKCLYPNEQSQQLLLTSSQIEYSLQNNITSEKLFPEQSLTERTLTERTLTEIILQNENNKHSPIVEPNFQNENMSINCNHSILYNDKKDHNSAFGYELKDENSPSNLLHDTNGDFDNSIRIEFSSSIDYDGTDEEEVVPSQVYFSPNIHSHDVINTLQPSNSSIPIPSDHAILSNFCSMKSISQDVATHIFSFIPLKYIRSLASVSRLFYEASKDNSIWKSIYEEAYFLNVDKKQVEKALFEGYFKYFLKHKMLNHPNQEYFTKYILCSKIAFDQSREASKIVKKSYILEKLQYIFRLHFLSIIPNFFWLFLIICTVTLSVLADQWTTSTLGRWLCSIPSIILILIYLLITCCIVMDPLWTFARNRYIRNQFKNSSYVKGYSKSFIDKDTVGCMHYLIFGNMWIVLLFFGFFGCLGMKDEKCYYSYWFIPLYVVTIANCSVPIALMTLRYLIFKEPLKRLKFPALMFMITTFINLFVFIQVFLVALKLDGVLPISMAVILLPLWLLIIFSFLTCCGLCCSLPVSCFFTTKALSCGYFFCCFTSILTCVLFPVVISTVMMTIHFEWSQHLYYIICFIPMWILFLFLWCITTCCAVSGNKVQWN